MTIVSLLSSKSPFVIPLEKKEEADRAKREFARGEPSDHLAVLNAYRSWTLSKDKGAFCWQNFLSAHTLRMVLDMRNQVTLCGCVCACVNLCRRGVGRASAGWISRSTFFFFFLFGVHPALPN